MRVLIVEDSDSICRMIQALVAARGFEVRSAGSGARGLEEAFSWKPHIVLLDINLPGSYDGLEVCAKLRSEAHTKDTPVIIISAMNDDEVKRRAADVGANAFYEKPFSPLALLKEIEALAKRSEAIKI
ncbi:MAG: response regulator [Labilithrix sp.]|nr:response regulator [Labilithrix sp.]